MIVTGLAWLTYILPNVASHLVPVNLLAASLGEVAMILWLLLRGVSDDKWVRPERSELANA